MSKTSELSDDALKRKLQKELGIGTKKTFRYTAEEPGSDDEASWAVSKKARWGRLSEAEGIKYYKHLLKGYRLSFGRFKGQLLLDAIEIDEKYFRWVLASWRSMTPVLRTKIEMAIAVREFESRKGVGDAAAETFLELK